jgi:hypothetical protein
VVAAQPFAVGRPWADRHHRAPARRPDLRAHPGGGRARLGRGAGLGAARLTYLWHIYGEREDATEVDVRFAASGDATTVTIVHRGWERLDARGEELRRRNRQGWDGLLPHYLRACPLATRLDNCYR